MRGLQLPMHLLRLRLCRCVRLGERLLGLLHFLLRAREGALRLGACARQTLLVRRHGRVQLGSGVLLGEGFLIEQLGRLRLGRLELLAQRARLGRALLLRHAQLLAQLLGERLLGLKCPLCRVETRLQ